MFPPRRRPPIRAGGPPPRGPWHSRLSPELPGSLFSGSPWPPRAGFTCQRRFRPEQKTRPLTASPGARLSWQRRPRGQAASNHSCWIRLVRALMLGAQTQRHPAGAERACCFPGAPFPLGPRPPTCPPSCAQVPTESPEPRPLAPTPPASTGQGTSHCLSCHPRDEAGNPPRPQLTSISFPSHGLPCALPNRQLKNANGKENRGPASSLSHGRSQTSALSTAALLHPTQNMTPSLQSPRGTLTFTLLTSLGTPIV